MTSRWAVALIALLVVVVVGLGAPAFAQFERRSSFSLGKDEAFSVVVGDFNRDGKLDVAVVTYLPTASVKILLGNGDGTFRGGMTYAVGVQPFYMVTADLRRSGTLDLVVTDSLSNDLYVLLGKGDGTFQTPVAYQTNGSNSDLATRDFTGDGKLDIIAITGYPCDCVSVLPGHGDGTFGEPVTTPIPYNIGGLAIAPGHFNADKKLDIAVVGTFGTANRVDILLGNGDGTFRPNGFYDVSLSPQSVVVADFNGDKKDDLAVGNYLGSSISVLSGYGDGTFQQAVNYDTEFPTWLLAQDLDGDGKIDLAASNFGGPSSPPAGVSVFKGNGDGTFQTGVVYPAGLEANFVGAGDFNGDHQTDLVLTNDAGNSPSNSITTLLNTGVVSFSPTTPLNFPFQLVGTISPPQTVTLTNLGTNALTISSETVKGPFAPSSTCGSSVAPGGSCNISVTFFPKTQGSKSGTISIHDSASTKPQVIEMNGAGTVVEFSPPSLSFSAQKVGTKSAPQAVQVTNTGSTVLSITKLIDNGANSKDFPQTSTCSSSLSAGASCTITVTFEPQKIGPRSGLISITDNGGGSPQTVPLTGTGS